MKRLPLKHGLELAPMVDIVFLLLAHFLITASVARWSVLELQLPDASTGSAGTNQVIEVRVDRQGHWHLAERPVRDDELSNAVRALHQSKPKARIRIAADRAAPYGRVLRCLDALRAAGLRDVELAAEVK